MPDFDFDTRKPQGSDEPNRPRMTFLANRLTSLLGASKHRIWSMASTLRRSLMANKLRSLLIGGVLIFVVAPASVGLLIYMSNYQEDGSSTEDLSAAANGNSALNQAEEGGELNSAMPVGTEQLKSTTPVDPAQQLVFGIRNVGLYAMEPSGSNPTRLTDGDSPAWSPDGKQIAYTKYLKEPNPAASSAPESVDADPYTESPSIFVMDADGSGGRQLLDKSALAPEWSPDGKEIAFSLNYPKTYKGANYGYCGIYIMDADGSGTPRKLATGPGCASSPAWSPDGKQIAYTNGEGLDESGGSDTSDVYVVNAPGVEGGTDQPRALTDYSPDTAGGPSWSPDGTEIAYIVNEDQVYANRTGKAGIYKMNADGSGKTPIALNEPTKDYKTTPVWSPDGDQIAYVRGISESYGIYFREIYIMDSDGSNPILVRAFGRGSVTGLDWRALP